MIGANSLVIELDPGRLVQLQWQDPALRMVVPAFLNLTSPNVSIIGNFHLFIVLMEYQDQTNQEKESHILVFQLTRVAAEDIANPKRLDLVI
ncbi:hypothetical protein T265_15168, partial [Opisthorchis viverrini]